jgi:2-C-methyl-D-erythritol 4-phosphate cytidylyltransferase
MTTAIILAAGRGTRMGTAVPKQFLSVDGIPILVRTLRVFAESPEVDEILLVTSEDYADYCRHEIVEKWGIRKVRDIVIGGKERWNSVWNALLRCESSDYVMIQDGARPFVTEEIIKRTDAAMKQYGACAVGMPSKDTIKICDDSGFVRSTPSRKYTWIIQTPQAFFLPIIRRANEIMQKRGMEGVTDDAMIVEASGIAKVKLVEGSYENIKVTTPDDLKFFRK